MRMLNFIDAVEKTLELHVVSALAYWNNIMVIAITILHNYMIMKIRVQLHCTGLNV